jgi:hypothetical protein
MSKHVTENHRKKVEEKMTYNHSFHHHFLFDLHSKFATNIQIVVFGDSTSSIA